MLSALYYPFSRCIDACALKQLLLVFDSVTFLDPVDDDAWRAKLFRDLETAEDPRFRSYRGLEQPLNELRQEGVIRLQAPTGLAAYDLPDTTCGAISDLQDDVWCGIARNPSGFGMPHANRGFDGSPSWQIFESKFPPALRRILDIEPSLGRHIVWKGDRRSSWTVSYEAGSAVALNLHLAAAQELNLAPFTDSDLHHRLLLRKITRSLSPDLEWQRPSSDTVAAVVNRAAIQLIEDLLPRTKLMMIGFESILRFREETRAAREAMMQQLGLKFAVVASMSTFSEVAAAEASIIESLGQEVRSYRAVVEAARNKMWPDLIRASSTALTTSVSAGVALQFLAGGLSSILWGSMAVGALALLPSALERRAEARAAARSASPAVAYLSSVADFAGR